MKTYEAAVPVITRSQILIEVKASSKAKALEMAIKKASSYQVNELDWNDGIEAVDGAEVFE